MINPLQIIQRFYATDSPTFAYLVEHSRCVTEKALEVAQRLAHLQPDLQFIEEAAMLHDIGIFGVDAPRIGCHGDKPYVCHGTIGRELLEQAGYPRHAIVCESHIGVGLSRQDIRRQNLPLPDRDMLPSTLEEKIISYADKFYTKAPGRLSVPRSLEKIERSLRKYGEDKVAVFREWHALFGDGKM